VLTDVDSSVSSLLTLVLGKYLALIPNREVVLLYHGGQNYAAFSARLGAEA
jgi:hypothetical protein